VCGDRPRGYRRADGTGVMPAPRRRVRALGPRARYRSTKFAVVVVLAVTETVAVLAV
jgi:hypothetical protein